MSAAGRTAWYLLAGHAVVLVAGLGVNMASAHALGPGGRGELALLLQLSYLLGVVLVAGVDRAYPAALPAPATFAAARREVAALVAPAAVPVGLGCAAVAALLAVRGAGAPALYPLLVGGLAIASLGLTTIRISAATVADGRGYLRANVAAQALLLAGAALLALTARGGPAAWLAVYAAAPLTAVAAHRFAARPPDPRRVSGAAAPAGAGDAAGPDPAAVARRRRIRAAGRRLLPGALASFATLRADRLLIPLLAGLPALGLYAVAAAFAELCLMPVQNYVDAHLPRWHLAAADGALPAGGLLLRAAGYAVAAALAVTAVGTAFIRLGLPAAFAGSALVLPLLAAAAGGWAVSRVAAGLALARRPAAAVSVADGAVLAVTAGGHLLLIPRYGLWGAAVAALAGYLLAAAAMSALALGGGRRPAGAGREAARAGAR
ncbi:hypothetical protein GCM10010123_21750 [Pilimelia anulata]|uniref:Polysaccharide biosynthesis protein n=1 Tax=Pilimelia anulata TaxID=53371 RepID=A0A8J3B3E0_9ACTN|nr:hypothetical protein [Pilimelia anulata]GGJ91580.1 hypothetical protein GCM10010123_21750 [Pilimelia anulata]